MLVLFTAIGLLIAGHVARRALSGALGVRGLHWVDVSPVFFGAPRWKRVAAQVVGPVVVYFLVALLHGALAARPTQVPTLVLEPIANLPAVHAGVRSGDVAVALDGNRLSDWADLVAAVKSAGGQPVELDIMRGEHDMTFAVTPGEDGKLGLLSRMESHEPGVRQVLAGAVIGPWRTTGVFIRGMIDATQTSQSTVAGPVTLVTAGQGPDHLALLALVVSPAMPVALLADLIAFLLLVRAARPR